jgi:hypothetical protein
MHDHGLDWSKVRKETVDEGIEEELKGQEVTTMEEKWGENIVELLKTGDISLYVSRSP